MTHIEALLDLDRGHVPADTAAFFGRDPQVARWWRRAGTSVTLEVVAIACAAFGASFVWSIGLASGAVVLATTASEYPTRLRSASRGEPYR